MATETRGIMATETTLNHWHYITEMTGTTWPKWVAQWRPNYPLFDLLSLNIRTNNLSKVEVHNVGLWDKPVSVTMYRNSQKSNLNWSVMYQNEDSPITSVQLVLLSSIIEEKENYALKLDVEGSEINIINELIHSGKVKYIDELIVEVHPAIIKASLPAMLNQLETSGFEYHVVKDSLHKDSTEIMVYAKRADREI